MESCADSGIFSVGGGGVDLAFCFYLSPQLILQRGSNGLIEKTILFQRSRGGPTFFREGGGVQTLISIENHLGGSEPPIPLWIRT